MSLPSGAASIALVSALENALAELLSVDVARRARLGRRCDARESRLRLELAAMRVEHVGPDVVGIAGDEAHRRRRAVLEQRVDVAC